ncbi:unnamed protein product [Dicrocoelium dendriticum]|nr:unnamed protein product [Dicrocoelium dendriticum]
MWKEFEKGLLKYLPESDAEIICVLRRKYLRTIKEFRQSKQCRTILRQCLQRISAQPNRIYMILNELKSTLKLRTTHISLNISPSNGSSSTNGQPQKSTSTTPKPTVATDPKESDASGFDSTTVIDLDDGDDLVILDLNHNTTPKPSVSPVANVRSPIQPNSAPEGTPNPSPMENPHKMLVLRLEKLLSRLNKAIRQLEEQELDFDALESPNSPYLQLDVLKRRYLQVWHRLCDIRKVAPTSGRIVRRKFHFAGSKHANINKRIEELVNVKHRFPDFTDIRRIVSQVNKEDGLGLSSSALSTLARELFIDVGHLLKRRRQDDLRHDFGCHLTDDLREEDDPTYFDPALRVQLAQNKQIAESNLNSVFDKFVRVQNESGSHVDDQNVESSEPEEPNLSSRLSSTALDAKGVQTEHNVNCLSSSSDDEAPAELPSEVLTLSSDSEYDCHISEPASPDRSQQPASPCFVPSTSVVTTMPRSPNHPHSPVINLIADDTDSLVHTSNPVSTDSAAPRLSAGYSFASASSQLIPPLQPCSAMPLLQETRHSSRTFTVTRQFGPNGSHTFMSSTQTATSNLFYQQVVAAPCFAPVDIPPHVHFIPSTRNQSRPSRGRLVPAPRLDRPRHSLLDSVLLDRSSVFLPGVNQPPPDSETIVLD